MMKLVPVLFALVAMAGPRVASAATWYVSPQAQDAWRGRLAEPNGDQTDGPFATLERAREALRAARACSSASA